MRRVLAVLLLAVTLAGCGAGKSHIARTDYGAAWPFTVESGDIECWRPDMVVLQVGEDHYGLNGSARGSGTFKDGKDITIEDASGAPADYDQFITMGLAMCPTS